MLDPVVVTQLDRSRTGKIYGTLVNVSNSDETPRLFAFGVVELGRYRYPDQQCVGGIPHIMAELVPGD